MPTPAAAGADEDLWQRTLATPAHWCRRCSEYRVRAPLSLCPVCLDEDRRRGPMLPWLG
jgi:hypothetical protein